MSDGIIYIGNTNVIELRALTNSVTDAVDTGAAVTVTLLDASDSEVAGETWPVSASHDADGTYHATLSDSVELVHGKTYTAKVTATGSGGAIGVWECPVTALDRRCV